MSRYPTNKYLYCHQCKRYRKHTRAVGAPVGVLLYRCTAYGCGQAVEVRASDVVNERMGKE